MKTAGSATVNKTNERPGTPAHVRYVRISPYKVRVVLDLIRGETIPRAAEILQYTERRAADVIGKCLASAVANAVNNDGQVVEELCVSACYADEGPTLKRWRPRARGRATRIRKRTCHITVIVGPMSEERLEVIRAKDSARAATGGQARARTSAEARRRRVERSRSGGDETAEVDAAEDTASDHAIATDDTDEAIVPLVGAVETIAADDDVAEADDGADAEAEAEADEIVEDSAVDAVVAAPETAAVADAADVADDGAVDTADAAIVEPHGPGSAAPFADGSGPEGYDIKGNAQSMLYHEPGSRYYAATKAEVYFASSEAAEAAGFARPGSDAADADEVVTVVADERFGAGSAVPLEDGSGPTGYEVKGNAQSMLYHEPGTRYYAATKAEVYFATADDAERAGFSKPGAAQGDDD